ncbi:MAG: hypothetical protein Q4E17_03925 [Synergistes sp.]|nr:hypothetical protein [Synergistes sp.]
MKELAKLIHAQLEDGADVVSVADRSIVIDRAMHFCGVTVFKNCDIEVDRGEETADYFVVEAGASVTFENCRFRDHRHKIRAAVITGAKDSRLTFVGCRFEIWLSNSLVSARPDGSPIMVIGSDGAVCLRGCEITYADWSTSGYDGEVFYFMIANGDDVEVTDSTFRCLIASVMMSCGCPLSGLELKERKGFVERAGIIIENGTMKNCTLKGLHKVVAGVLENCTLEDCNRRFSTLSCGFVTVKATVSSVLEKRKL